MEVYLRAGYHLGLSTNSTDTQPTPSLLHFFHFPPIPFHLFSSKLQFQTTIAMCLMGIIQKFFFLKQLTTRAYKKVLRIMVLACSDLHKEHIRGWYFDTQIPKKHKKLK